MLNENPYSRNDFIEKLKSILSDGFHKLMCGKIALAIGQPQPDNWPREVENILQEAKKLMDPTVTNFKAQKQQRIIVEAMNEASFSYLPILDAKYKVEDDYPKLWKEIKALSFEPEVEFKKMINDFLPEYSYLMPDEGENYEALCIRIGLNRKSDH